MNMKYDVNLYLFYEFGLDTEGEDEARVSDSWPFQLHDTVDPTIYEFTYSEDTYFASTHDALTFYPTAGMTVADVQVQLRGAQWIKQHNPLDLSTSRMGVAGIPSAVDRRTAIEAAARKAFRVGPPFHILEGLFLLLSKHYLALVEHEQTRHTLVIGTFMEPHPAQFPTASAWRRLAFGVGELLQAGELDTNI